MNRHDRRRARAERGSHIQAVYDGRRCLGFVLPRGKEGFEAFDSNDCSLGVFTTDTAAAAAIMRGAA